MNKKRLILLAIIIVLIVTILGLYTSKIQNISKVASQTQQKQALEEDTEEPAIEIIQDTSNFQKDRTIILTIKYKNLTEKISYADIYIEYDKEIFKEVENIDFSYDFTEDDLNYFSYNKERKEIMFEFYEDIDVETLCTLKLKVLDSITEPKETYFNVIYPYIYNYENQDQVFLKDCTETIKLPIGSEELYLSSKPYKIGDNDIDKYEDGDKYISRVQRETTKEEFISNLDTNGDITILKADGTQLGENELVGTGMTLVVTKDDEKIELKIAVMGDVDGNGKVTISDFATINKVLAKISTLKNEYKIAGDLDENGNITISDFATINKILAKLI